MRNKEKRTLDIPKDINLPLFAYGIFKPRQIAYSKIEDLVSEIYMASIDYSMRYRDGVPILTRKEHKQTNGFLLYFKDNKAAYEIISETFLNKLYKWDTIEIGDEKVNVLFGKKPEKGSDYEYESNYEGEDDPLFNEGIELIRRNLESANHYSHRESFFQLQMNYMLLWSAIDRYCRLKYNKEKEYDNRIELAEEEIFKEALLKYSDNHHRSVYNTENLFENRFDINNPKYCINYYYTLRCNIVHRGKSSIEDLIMLEQATKELLNIFEYILNDTFR